MNLKTDIVDALNQEGVEAEAVKIESAEGGGEERRSLGHAVDIPALVVAVTFGKALAEETAKQLIAKVVDVVRQARRKGDRAAEHVEEIIFYNADGSARKIIERRRID